MNCKNCIFVVLPDELEPCNLCDINTHSEFKGICMFYSRNIIGKDYEGYWAQGIVRVSDNRFRSNRVIEKMSDIQGRIDDFMSLREFLILKQVPTHTEQYLLSGFELRKMFIGFKT